MRKTNTKVMMAEITRIVLPKHCQIIECQQFRLLKQEENEPINSFEAKMMGKPMKIHIRDNVEPVAIHKPIPIPIPHHWQETVKADLDRD